MDAGEQGWPRWIAVGFMVAALGVLVAIWVSSLLGWEVGSLVLWSVSALALGLVGVTVLLLFPSSKAG